MYCWQWKGLISGWEYIAVHWNIALHWQQKFLSENPDAELVESVEEPTSIGEVARPDLREPEDIKEDIENKLQTEFPDVVVGEVNVIANQDNNEVVVNIIYAVANTGIEDEINLSFQ